MEYDHDTHTVHLIVYHIIFCPKRRRKILVGPIRERLQHIIREVAAENNWSVIELAIQRDHVHVFMPSNPRTLPTDSARLIKGRSSHLLRDEYPSSNGCRLCGLARPLIQRPAMSAVKRSSSTLRGKARANVDLRVQSPWEQAAICCH